MRLVKKAFNLASDDWVVAEAGRIIEVPRNRIEFIRQLCFKATSQITVKRFGSNWLLITLILATRLSLSVEFREQRQTALEEFKK